MPFISGTHESHSLRFARCAHQYVDKPRLHANYSLTELIFVIITKLRIFVNSEITSCSATSEASSVTGISAVITAVIIIVIVIVCTASTTAAFSAPAK